jgi:hypothetical protein
MVKPHSSLHSEIGRLSLFISLPQLIMAPISVGIAKLLYSHINSSYELSEIIDFLFISFPLTLTVALLIVIIEKGKFNLFTLLFAVIGAALLSNLLHMLVLKIPLVDLITSFNEVFSKDGRGGNNAAILLVAKIFGVYWKSFGPILFIQSCCIGIYAAYKYLKIEKEKDEKVIKN